MTCWREYDEFVILSKGLRNRFAGAAIPPLPEAFSALSSVSESQLKFRLGALRLFLATILRHPFMRSDEIVKLFLEANETFDKKAVEKLSSSESRSQAKWKGLLSFVDTPENAADLLKAVKKELSAVAEVYSSLLKDLKSLTSRLNSYAGTLKDFNISLESWRNVERTDLHKISALVAVEAGDEPSVTIASVLEKMQQANDDNRERVLSKAKQSVEAMKIPIKYELLVVQGYISDLEKAKEAISVNSKLQKAAEKKGAPGSPKAEKKSAEARETAKTTMETLVRGFLALELKRHRYERGNRNLKILRDLAELQSSVANAEAEQWKTLTGEMPTHTLCTAPDKAFINTDS